MSDIKMYGSSLNARILLYTGEMKTIKVVEFFLGVEKLGYFL